MFAKAFQVIFHEAINKTQTPICSVASPSLHMDVGRGQIRPLVLDSGFFEFMKRVQGGSLTL